MAPVADEVAIEKLTAPHVLPADLEPRVFKISRPWLSAVTSSDLEA